MFGAPNDPDEANAAGGDGARGETRDEIADMGDAVGDADAASDEEDGAVAMEGVESACVRAFNEGGDVVETAGVSEGATKDGVREAGAAAHDQGD